MKLHTDVHYMHRCLELAARGGVSVAPNPMVGAVLVYQNRIIGEGYHQQYGGAHAEVNCIASVLKTDIDKISKSTLYVSLEPCSHFGKTPPCTNLIVQHKIPRVVIGCEDSFEKVKGSGILQLKEKGVEVVVGILKKEALDVNRRFFSFNKYKRPYIVLKWAQTKDGFIATKNDSRLFISNELTNRLVHKWRSEEAAVLVGANTVLRDDPVLDNRLWFGPPPVKVIIDPRLRLPHHLKIFKGGVKTIVLNRLEEKTEGPVQYVKIEEGNFLRNALTRLYEMKIMGLFVEGGGKTLQSFIDAGFWDEAKIITNTNLFAAQGLTAPLLIGADLTGEDHILADSVQYFKNRNSNH